MKLALIGGGGVRAPEFVRGALAFAADLKLDEICLMDVDAGRLEVIAPLCAEIVRQAGSPFNIRQTTDLDDALRGAGMIVTTIRVGAEGGRVLDERIALRHNVLGQETTGPGGFSMAMRSIPAIIHVADRAEKLAPDAWIFNFTNPAGLVAQALYEAGYRRVVGICDSANTAQQEIAGWYGVETQAVKTEVFGLNHLSWTRTARLHGRDVLPEVLHNAEFINRTHLRFFGPEVVQRQGMFLNEYLYYYYFRDVALARIQAEELTRGEEIQQINEQMFAALRGLPPAEGLLVHHRYQSRRSAGYMACAESDEQRLQERLQAAESAPAQHEVSGYAGVALQAGLALTQDRPLRIGLNVPNDGAIAGMQDDDIVEVTCEVDGRGIHPVTIGDVPEDAYLLMRAVKRYERLAARAILERDRRLAVEALVAHPLVGSYVLARALVNEYLEAHRRHVGEWQ